MFLILNFRWPAKTNTFFRKLKPAWLAHSSTSIALSASTQCWTMCQHPTHTHMSQLSVPSTPPGAWPGCHTLFSSDPQAFAHLYYPSVQYGGIQLIQRWLLQGSSMWQRGMLLLSSPVAEYIMLPITGLLKRTDRYLIWEANPKQYTPLVMAELVV